MLQNEDTSDGLKISERARCQGAAQEARRYPAAARTAAARTLTQPRSESVSGSGSEPAAPWPGRPRAWPGPAGSGGNHVCVAAA